MPAVDGTLDQLIAGNDPDAIMLPARRVIVIVGMIGRVWS